MKGDFSRQSFDADSHYDGVLMQQGRVQLDADWNEQRAIDEYRRETEASAVIGRCGAPFERSGFRIDLSADRELTIDAGYYFVDGLLCENDHRVDFDQQPGLPDTSFQQFLKLVDQDPALAGLVYLDVWHRHVTALDDHRIRESALGGPDTATRSQTVWQVRVLPVEVKRADDGQRKKLEQERHSLEQKLTDLVKSPAAIEQHVSAIRNLQTQIKQLDEQLAKLTGPATCGTSFPEWTQLISPRGLGNYPLLKARTQAVEDPTTPCIIPPTAGYLGLENQLYRVEIHDAGTLGQATFKWSRDNGSVVTAIEAVNGSEIMVHDLGPDEVLGFAVGQWVELVDRQTDLLGQPGQLLSIVDVDPDSRVLTTSQAPGSINLARQPRLRRWDSQSSSGTLAVQVPTTDDGWIQLEAGIWIQFSSGQYFSGEYWLIPARTATGEIEWPPYEIPNTAPEVQRPLGIRHHYCRLAMLQLNEARQLTVQDCRAIFPPLAAGAMHATDMSWPNDEALSYASFLGAGLSVTLDRPPDPDSVDSSTFIVTLELGLATGSAQHSPGGLATPDLIFILDGSIDVLDNVIHWRPDVGSFAGLWSSPTGKLGLRVRVTIKGHKLWGLGNEGRRFHLDGQAFGRAGERPDKTKRIALQFPTGDGARASDFESWFWLGATPTPQADVPRRIGGRKH